MYTAKIIDVKKEHPNSENVNARIEYTNGVKTIEKTYNLYALNFSTIDSIKSFLQNECDKLQAFDDLESMVLPLIGVNDAISVLNNI